MKQIYEGLLNFRFRLVFPFEKTCQTDGGIIFNLIFGGFLLLAPNLRCEVETASRDIAEGNEAATEVTTPTYPKPVGRSENPGAVVRLIMGWA